MKWLVILLMFSHSSSAETHFLKIYFTGSSGLTNFPPFEVVGRLDDIEIAYCNKKIIDVKLDWVQKALNNDSKLFEFVKSSCFVTNPAFFTYIIAELMKNFNQTEGIHTLQRVGGCELNIETKELKGFLKYGYDGEDFLELDLKEQTWIALRKEAVFLKLLWDMDTQDLEFHSYLLTDLCYGFFNTSLVSGQSSLFKTDYPSVSLLQKTPSSPVRCHATGFYPKSFLMFWRKDGEEIHEGVNPGEVLNNEDNTFQYRIDLDISSIPSMDWGRYDCVFQFIGAEDKILIKLDKEVIETNWDESPQIRIIVIGVISAVIAITIIALAFTAYKKRNERPLTPDSENMSL
ncbi:PREDICTED: major histocompatibility complex class I-related gene protein-like isoform X2 [Poecilia mexicana]|uniref:major histocompatibility complex class I-related gene protein-like isoform X2 n=1 Tax=Poecilia mexicana TaxID=48701 RepID=UPI00072E7F55|nr:PREDICTED: major histocompatibility complex class I-related gene protein-like isoform X2 [Poecilia mexicana]